MKNSETVVSLQEMNLQEMKEVNGGIWHFIIGTIVGGLIYDCISDPESCIKSFSEGFKSKF